LNIKTLNSLKRPFVIAEIGGNHEGDFDYAVKLLQDAVLAGADAVKFQIYSPDRLVSPVESPERHKHFGRFALKTEQYVALAELCRENKVQFMSSLWDLEAIELFDPYINIHKVGSGDLTNYRLLKVLAEKDKPLCIATAMSQMDEIKRTIDFINSVNPKLMNQGKLCVMHCVATYGEPSDEFANLRSIDFLRNELSDAIVIGYSDHTKGHVAAEVAVCMGARVVEMHFTDDTEREFRDHHFSFTRETLADFVDFCRRREAMMGSAEKTPISRIETADRIWEFRRAVYFKQDMRAGDVADENNLTTLRPNSGIGAQYYFEVLGKKLKSDKRAFEKLSWTDFN